MIVLVLIDFGGIKSDALDLHLDFAFAYVNKMFKLPQSSL